MQRGSVPRTLDVAVVAVLTEVTALVGLALWWVVEMARGQASALGVALFLVVFALGVAAVLLGSVRALRRGRRWARGPVMTWQLLQGATAFAVLQGVASDADGALAAWLARLAIVLAGVVLVLTVTRPVVHFTT